MRFGCGVCSSLIAEFLVSAFSVALRLSYDSCGRGAGQDADARRDLDAKKVGWSS
jgi:hypothetical protein